MACTLTAVPYSAVETVARECLVLNPDFAVDLTGWSSFGGATIARTGTGADAALAMTVTTTPGGTAFPSLASGMGTCSPSTAYVVTASIGLPGGLAGFLDAEEYNASNALVATTSTPIIGSGAPTVLSKVTTATTVKIRPVVRITSAVAGVGYVGWAHVEKSSTWTGDRFDGDTSNAGRVGSRFGWAGTPHASVSHLTTRTPTGAVSVTAELVTQWSATRQSATVLHQVLGRPDPAPALGALRTRTGAMEVWCADEATAYDLVALYAPGVVVMLRDPDHPDLEMYHVATRVAAAPAPEPTAIRRWLVGVDFAEVYQTADLW